MTERKRARDLKIGDTVPDGDGVVYRITSTLRGLDIWARRADGSRRRMKYMPDTILPTDGTRHPSRFEAGHPWTRKGVYQRKQ